MLDVQGLVKVYEGRTVVNGVTFRLEPGTVTAFLGPNGAGKSTTLRMICGLTTPTHGMALVGGRPFDKWPSPAHVAGVLLDATAVHPGRTGRGHLRTMALLAGVPYGRVDQLLEQVGLAKAANRKIGKYSLGMRQRLGLAHALLANPPLLILDEPINGLDPEGIRSIRQLLRNHAAQGGTVLLSSHVLSEVDQTADRVLMIAEGHPHQGRIVADGPLHTLVSTSRSKARVADPQALIRALFAANIQAQQVSPNEVVVEAVTQTVSDIAFQARVQIFELSEVQQDLEELFFRITGGGHSV